jgi:hypothetical protein
MFWSNRKRAAAPTHLPSDRSALIDRVRNGVLESLRKILATRGSGGWLDSSTVELSNGRQMSMADYISGFAKHVQECDMTDDDCVRIREALCGLNEQFASA